jgi:hypothetical protein
VEYTKYPLKVGKYEYCSLIAIAVEQLSVQVKKETLFASDIRPGHFQDI